MVIGLLKKFCESLCLKVFVFKYANNWRLNNALLNNRWVIEEIREEIKSSWNLMEMKHNLLEPVGYSKGSPKRKVYSHECIY
jgi:hypothetical protein